MSHDRRAHLSRRRRMISAQILALGDAAPTNSRSRRLSDADRPVAAAYGARVHRRLRARWFELVPVRRRSLLVVKAIVLFAVGLLIAGHYLSMTWARLYEYPELARPLRLDNPASFGGWFGSIAMGLSAGLGFLVYQLRRYRADDYRGQYRIWRPVIATLLLLSIDSISGTLDWFGAILDMLLAGRAPMAGGDWLRLLLCVTGFALTARLLIEMRHSPAAAVWLILGAVAVSSRLPIRWHFIEMEPLASAMIVGVGPLIGRVAVFLSLITYLRWIYRDVRGFNSSEGHAIRIRLPRFGRQHSGTSLQPDEEPPRRRRASKVEAEPEQKSHAETRRGWFGRASNDEGRSESELPSTPTKRFGGFLRRKPSNAVEVAKLDTGDERDKPNVRSDPESTIDSKPSSAKKRSWFGRKPKEQADASTPDAVESDSQDSETESISEIPLNQRIGLRQWFRKKKLPASDSELDSTGLGDQVGSESDDHNDENIPKESVDVDNIDWSSMSKAERRRMKKLMRRQDNDAA